MLSSYVQHLSDSIDSDPCAPDFLTKHFIRLFHVMYRLNDDCISRTKY